MNDTVKRLMGLVDDVIAASHEINHDYTAERQVLEAENKCSQHPKAPHGFDRNSSHSAHRYVCECESWEPYDAGFNAGFQAGMKAEQALCELSDQTQEMEAQPRKAAKLTDEAIVDGFCSQSHNVQFVSVFRSGVRWAEKQHGIGGG